MSARLSILAIDPGKKTGWYRLGGGPRPAASGLFDIGRFEDHGQALAMWSDWLDKSLTLDPPQVLAIERAIFVRGHALGELTTAMVRLAHALGWAHNVRRWEATANSVRKGLCGKAKATDPEIRAAVRAAGLDPMNEHEADAAALAIVCRGALA